MFDPYEEELKEQGFDFIIGIDEAGRGPLAGPVVASAVSISNSSFISKIADSKKLTPKNRQSAFKEIYENSFVGIGVMNESVIDRCNILQATYFAMNNAVEDLVSKLPDVVTGKVGFFKKVYLLIDGNRFRSNVPYRWDTVVQGDTKVQSIACASIIAKVTRDRIIDQYDKIYPQYGFCQHKGYPTKQHKEAIKKFGLSSIHRKSFAPCQAV